MGNSSNQLLGISHMLSHPHPLPLFYKFTKAFERFEIFRNENIYFSKIKQTQGNVMEQTIEKRMFSFTDSAQDIPCQGAGWWS